MAAFGLLQRNETSVPLPPDALARVGDVVIDEARLSRTLEQYSVTTGRQATGDDRSRLLQQLVDEELLLQRGIDLGLTQSDLTVRNAIVQSLIASVTAEADAADPDDEALQAFLDENAGEYSYASAMRVRAWTSDDEAAARAFLLKLQDEANLEVPQAVAPVPGLPDSAAPVERLRMFLGPAIAAAAAEMPVGGSAVFARQGRWYVVQVLNRESSAVADLETVRSQLLIDYRRMLANQMLRDYIDDLRERSDVWIAAH